MNNKHYIITDTEGRIIDGWSDGPCPHRGTTGTILLKEDSSYQFRLFSDWEENPTLTDLAGVHLWRYEDGAIRAATKEEREAQGNEVAAAQPPVTPTLEDRLAAIEAIQLEWILGGAV